MIKMVIRGCFAVLLCAVLALTGCSNKNHGLNPKDPVTIEVWHYYNGAQLRAFDKLIEGFNSTDGKELGIVVEAVGSGGLDDLITNLQSELKKSEDDRDMPNVFACYVDLASEFNQAGLITDLSEYLTEEEIGEFLPVYVEEGKIDGGDGFKLFPIAKSTEVLMVNKTDWDQFSAAAGVTTDDLKTWEGVTGTAKKYYEWTDGLTPEPGDGKAMYGRDSMANYMIVGAKQLGEEMFQVEKGKLNLNVNKETMKKLWNNYYLPFVSGYFGAYGRFRSDDTKTGDIIMLAGSISGATYFPDEVTIGNEEPYDIEAMILPLPNFEGTSPYCVQQGAGMAVTKSDEKKEYAGVKFLQWFTQSDRNIKFALESSYLPVKKEACNQEYIDKVVTEQNLQWKGIIKDTIQTAVDETNNYTMYAGKPFDSSVEARKILEKSMSDQAVADRARVKELTDMGQSVEEALDTLKIEVMFEAWYSAFKEQLEQVCQ